MASLVGATLTHSHYNEVARLSIFYAGHVGTGHGNALVVGSGVVGATCAFRLARHGWRVTVFDPLPGRGATWAAAGMLAPGAEIAPGEKENYHSQCGALESWRALSSELSQLTHEQLGLYDTGTLLVGLDASDRALVTQFQSVAQEYGSDVRLETRESNPDYFVGVSPRVREGLFVAGDGWLDPDQAMSILAVANDALGVQYVTREVLEISRTGNSVGASTGDETFRGDVGILATGARPLPAGVRGDSPRSVRPVRGTTLRVHGLDRSPAPTLRAFVHGRAFYMVSRPGGYCVLGASSDERSDATVEVGELSRMLRDALELVPDLDSAAFVEVRQGLRPATHDHRPFFDVLEERWAWLSGHYRHGVTLAPLASLEALEFANRFS